MEISDEETDVLGAAASRSDLGSLPSKLGLCSLADGCDPELPEPIAKEMERASATSGPILDEFLELQAKNRGDPEHDLAFFKERAMRAHRASLERRSEDFLPDSRTEDPSFESQAHGGMGEGHPAEERQTFYEIEASENGRSEATGGMGGGEAFNGIEYSKMDMNGKSEANGGMDSENGKSEANGGMGGGGKSEANGGMGERQRDAFSEIEDSQMDMNGKSEANGGMDSENGKSEANGGMGGGGKSEANGGMGERQGDAFSEIEDSQMDMNGKSEANGGMDSEVDMNVKSEAKGGMGEEEVPESPEKEIKNVPSCGGIAAHETKNEKDEGDAKKNEKVSWQYAVHD